MRHRSGIDWKVIIAAVSAAVVLAAPGQSADQKASQKPVEQGTSAAEHADDADNSAEAPSKSKSKAKKSAASGADGKVSNAKPAPAATGKAVRIELTVPRPAAKGDTKKGDVQKGDAKSDPKLGAKPGATPADAAGKGPSAETAAGKDKANGKAWPKTLDDAKAEAEAKNAPPAVWSDAEIADAKNRCTAILKRIQAVAIPEAPLKHGMCGAPAPIQLVSIGRNPEVVLSPPSTVTCEMAEALYSWMKSDVQPLARKHLSADVIKIEVMSAYSCRNAYGRAGGRLSEHGLANALDIRGFITSAGKTAYVLESWGDTARDAARRLAAAKAAEEKKAREAAAAAAARAAPPVAGAPAKPGTDSSTGSIAAKPARGKDGAGEPALALEEPATAATPAKTKPALSITLRPGQSEDGVAGTNTGIDIGISRLGGPKATTLARASDKPAVGSAASKPSGPPRITQFLRETHAAACRIFGTTLGPEANEAHRNHFHVDMAPRKSTKICD